MAFKRRDLFRLGTIGGAGLLGALAWPGSKWLGGAASSAKTGEPALGLDCTTEGRSSREAAAYAARYSPAAYVTAGSRDAMHSPPMPGSLAAGGIREFDLSVIQTTLEVANGRNVQVWAYGGTVPGPILRATVGERLRVKLTNHSNMPHTVHFHGAHDVNQDGLTRIAPGETGTYDMTAGPVGFHPYHCHVPPYAWHMGKGMYGALIVDPIGGRPAAHEFVLCLCGFDVEGSGRNDTYAWNGVAGYYEKFPLKVPVGELVRIYLMNMVEHDSLASFHLHAHTFDLFRSGTSLSPHEHTDIVSLGPAERAILEFRLPNRGRYMFHPHQSHMAERGAMGWIVGI